MTTPPPARPSPAQRWLKALELTAGLDAAALTFPDLIDDLARRQGDRPALLSDAECLSFSDLAARSCRYSRWALSLGLPSGATVGLLMPNRPDYLAAWIGITRIGLTAALLNTNLTGASLAHCIAVAAPAHVVVAGDCGEAFAGALPHLATSPRAWRRSDGDLDAVLAALAGDPLTAEERRPVTLSDRALCIYTSGTTGRPKAANVSHRRIMTWSRWFAGLAGLTVEDRMYDCLPLFHSVGGVVAPGCVLSAGRLGGDRRPLLGVAVLGRRPAMGLHDGPVHRRALPLPARRRAGGRRAAVPSPAALPRQRPAPRHLGGLQGPVRHPRDPRILRRHRGQLLARERRGQGRLHRPHPARPGASLPGRHRAGSTSRPARRRGAPTASAAVPRPTRSAKPSAASAAARARAASRATRAGPTATSRCCATCSRPATAGSGRAT